MGRYQTCTSKSLTFPASLTPHFQSAFLPSAEPLHTLSSYLDATRSPLPDVPFPGHARATDLVWVDAGRPAPPGLSPGDVAALRELWSDLHRICTRAKERRVRIIIDAEYSWWQPAIDAYTVGLSRTFNHDEPLIYGTYQAYLRRTPAQIAHALKDAKKEGYSLGVKLVRGAYHPHEIARHAKLLDTSDPHPTAPQNISVAPALENPPPVWERIEHTDATYAACTGMLLDAVVTDITRAESRDWCSWRTGPPAMRIGLLFGTHNPRSAAGVVHGLVARGLATTPPPPEVDRLLPHPNPPPPSLDEVPVVEISAEVADRVAIGQLYGMCDWLTDTLAERVKAPSPFVLKVRYGV